MDQTGIAEKLDRYRAKRNFDVTPEPVESQPEKGKALSFVVQKHAATRLHYDFRLELDGVLLSWAVPKGPSYDPADKRMAVRTEDHPLSYASFEGEIPKGQYGAGQVIVWDRGSWTPLSDPQQGLINGKLAFELHGEKLKGSWELIRIKSPREARQEPWILFKRRDERARSRSEYDVVTALPDSVLGSAPAAAAGVAQAEAKAAGAAVARAKASAGAGKTAPTTAGAATRAAADSAATRVGSKAALPDTLSPQLATLASEVPTHGEWIYEIKFDGYRVLARIDQRGKARLFTRAGNDWTAKMPRLADELTRLQLPPAWIDGEVVVLDDQGVPDFNALQNAFDTAKAQRLTYFAFDLPFFDGRDLRQEPLTTRRALLRQVLQDHAPHPEQLRFSEDFPAEAGSVLQAACRMNLEGVIAKRADAPYRNDRSTTWLKLKCQQRQEFVIGGFTERSDAPGQIGSLLLGLHDERGVLRSVGAVGTGWNFEVARRLFDQLSALQQPAPPFDAEPLASPGADSGMDGSKDGSKDKATRSKLAKRPVRRTPAGARWVQPSLMAEVAFGGFTPDGQIRHASFVAQRSDKEPRMITLEKPIKPSAGATPAKDSATRVGGINISNAKRVIDPQSGTTKIDLVRYYESVASYMLPHLKGRAVALVRGPAGIGGQLFFQKHDDKKAPDAPVEVATLKALLQGAQLNVIEFHTGNSRPAGTRKPDRVVFDLDPGEGVGWPQIQEAAQVVRALLQELELQTWLKTSGGKGLHLVLPIAARWDADVVKDFSRAVVEHLARTLPDRFVAKSGGGNRVGRIFVDYLRNGSEATTVAAFSARARPGMGVSMPMSWDDLPGLKSGAHFTVANARDHLSFQTQDPWASYWQTRQSLSGAMKLLGLRKTSA